MQSWTLESNTKYLSKISKHMSNGKRTQMKWDLPILFRFKHRWYYIGLGGFVFLFIISLGFFVIAVCRGFVQLARWFHFILFRKQSSAIYWFFSSVPFPWNNTGQIQNENFWHDKSIIDDYTHTHSGKTHISNHPE